MATMAATSAARMSTTALDAGSARGARASSSAPVQVRWRGGAMRGLAVTVRQARRRRSSAAAVGVRAMSSEVHGQDPEWSDDDYIVLGLAHAFRKGWRFIGAPRFGLTTR